MALRARARALARRLDLALRARVRSRALAFTSIFLARGWSVHDGSVSGKGSSMHATRVVRPALERLVRELDVGTLLDVPCGDVRWMTHVDLGATRYVGGDIVPLLVWRNRLRFPERTFRVVDLVRGPLPRADLILCRDCLVHLPDDDVARALETMSESGAKWLLTTTFPGRENRPLATLGEWRALDLTRPPFSLPPPERVVVEECDDPGYEDKALGLWRLPLSDRAGR